MDENLRLRRAIYDVKNKCIELADDIKDNEDAVEAMTRARVALFEAWTYLCTPPEEDEDH